MALPKKLRIGYADYTVCEYPADESAEGDHDRSGRKIRVRTKDRPDSWVANTLIHEILHGLFYYHGLHELPQMSFQKEEVIVCNLANGLSQVFRDNPDVARKIISMALKK